jgi:hypothetical protein
MKKLLLSKGEICLVNDEDFDYLNQWTWTTYISRSGIPYVGRRQRMVEKSVTVYLHRDILKLQKGEYGDHINGNTLDNRRDNLRKATSSQNGYNKNIRKDNSTGFKGVLPVRDKFIANIKVGPNRIHLGTFSTPKEAGKAYDEAAIKYFGEFAKTNKMLGLL